MHHITKGRRSAPLSVRLSPDERAVLVSAAGGQPLGAYIKARLFAGDAPVKPARRAHNPVRDARTLAQILARLGDSRLASNLNQIAHAAHTVA